MSDISIPEYRVTVDQLRPGVFIRLEKVNWFGHPFLFNTFKIRSEEQIAVLKELGVGQVICIPEKSDCLPISPLDLESEPEPTKPPAQTKSAVDAAMERLWEIKKARTRRLLEKKKRIAECEEHYTAFIKDVSTMTRSVLSGDEQAVLQALEYVKRMTQFFLGDIESTLHLMNIMTPVERIYSHSLNTAILSMMLGREAGLGEEEMITLGMGAMFHDIGKERLEKKLLRKRGELTRSERAMIETHTRLGVEILEPVKAFPRRSLEIIAGHHELCDGSGYPGGLKQDAIDPLARMVAVADTYDNHCNSRDPRESLTPYLALSYMFSQQKQMFDPGYLSMFIRCLGVYPPGTVVQLSNAAIGMVMAVNPAHQLSPSLVLYDPEIPKKEALIVDLAEEPDLKVEKSIRLNHLPPEIFEYLSPRTRISYYIDPDADQ